MAAIRQNVTVQGEEYHYKYQMRVLYNLGIYYSECERGIHTMQVGELINRQDRLTEVEIKQKYFEIFCISELSSVNFLH